jgi:hypothetical protein
VQLSREELRLGEIAPTLCRLEPCRDCFHLIRQAMHLARPAGQCRITTWRCAVMAFRAPWGPLEHATTCTGGSSASTPADGHPVASASIASPIVALSPNNAEILAEFGMRLALMGQWERGIGLIDGAIARNPAHPGWYHTTILRHRAIRSGRSAGAPARWSPVLRRP